MAVCCAKSPTPRSSASNTAPRTTLAWPANTGPVFPLRLREGQAEGYVSAAMTERGGHQPQRLRPFFNSRIAQPPPRRTADVAVVGERDSFGDERVGRDNTPRADTRVAQPQSGVFDAHPVPQRPCVDDRVIAQPDVGSDQGWCRQLDVNRRAAAHSKPWSDLDPILIAAHHRAGFEQRWSSNLHPANQKRVVCEGDPRANSWR